MKEIPKWFKELVIVIIVVLFIRTFLVQAYNIPSGYMKPTLLVGDFILVNKLVYKLSEDYIRAGGERLMGISSSLIRWFGAFMETARFISLIIGSCAIFLI